MTKQERLAFFSNNYELIADGIYSVGPKKYIKDGNERFCRFCQKDKNKTSFQNEAHAIPECLGNHQLILLDECDECNTYFSEELEDHLDKFSKPFRVAAQIKGKKGIPSYKSLNKKSRVDTKDSPVIKSQEGETFWVVDEKNKTITVNYHQEPHIPIAAYKALIKISISVIESTQEIEPFRQTINWLRTSNHSKSVINPAMIFRTFIPGPRPTDGVVVMLFRRKLDTTDLPYSICILGFGNLILQFIVPSHIDDGKEMKLKIPFFPSPFEFMEWKFGEIKHEVVDMSGTEKVKMDCPLVYSFEEMKEIDPSDVGVR